MLRLGDDGRWREALPYAPLLEARAQVRLAQRRPAEAREDALASRALVEERFGGTLARGILRWRLLAATAAAALGDTHGARKLCDEDLELARAGDRPREIGAALRVAASLAQGDRRIELCREAVEALERSESTLELMHALVDLGGALRRAGHRQAAREPLARALDLATPRGATALAQRAREELLAAGARPRRAVLSGVESLTPSELRVARLAADGLTNREVAEALFVSRKTVDFHLGHVYRKLGVQRDGLRPALSPGSEYTY